MVLPKSFERCMLFLIAHGIYVGAYGIRPVLHRPSRAANLRRNIAKPRNLGRMQYALTAAQSFDCLRFGSLQGVLHTPFTPPHEPRRMNNASHRGNMAKKQGRAFAFRPLAHPLYGVMLSGTAGNLDYSSSAFAET